MTEPTERIVDSVGREFLFDNPTGEPVLPFLAASSEILDRYNGPLDVVVDIGAHVGTFTLIAAKRGAGLVVACEPDPENHARLTNNVAINKVRDKVVILPLAVSLNSFDLLSLQRTAGGGGNSGQSSLVYSFVGSETHKVFTIGFADLLTWIKSTKTKIDLLKLDIEGAEWPLLSQSETELNYLFNHVGYVDIELHPLPASSLELARSNFKVAREVLEGRMNSLGYKGTLQVVGEAARYYGGRS